MEIPVHHEIVIRNPTVNKNSLHWTQPTRYFSFFFYHSSQSMVSIICFRFISMYLLKPKNQIATRFRPIKLNLMDPVLQIDDGICSSPAQIK